MRDLCQQDGRFARICSAGLLLVSSVLAGCTSLETSHAGQLGPGLPIGEGDRIVIHPKGSGPGARPKSLQVTSIGADSISGKSPADGGAILTYRWDGIKSIEYRQYDARKTSALAILVALFIASAIDFGDKFGDFLESF